MTQLTGSPQSFALGAVLVFVSVLPASAQPTLVAGTLELGYSKFDSPTNTNDWAGLGSVVATFGNPGFNIQLNVADDNIQVPSTVMTTSTLSGNTVTSIATTTKSNASVWKYGGDIFWRDHAGIIGVNGSAETENAASNISIVTTTITAGTPKTGPAVNSSTSIDHGVESAGLFGEYFVLTDLTLRGKGGWFTGDYTGYYGDGAVVYYPYRQFAIQASADYSQTNSGERTEAASAKLEYLPIPSVPFSLVMQYTYAKYRGLPMSVHGGESIFGAAFKVYFDGEGASLREYQRNSVSAWDGPPRVLIGRNF
jgi:hypothetical protein